MTDNGVKTRTGDEKSLVTVRRKRCQNGAFSADWRVWGPLGQVYWPCRWPEALRWLSFLGYH